LTGERERIVNAIEQRNRLVEEGYISSTSLSE